MANEPKVDRVKFHRDIEGYFRDRPLNDFLVFDDNLNTEEAENYSLYTDLSDINTVVVKVGTSMVTHDDYRRTIYNMNCISEDLIKIRDEKNLNVLLVTSGAIGLGRKARLKKGEKIVEDERNNINQKLRDAVEGQFLLYELWRHHFYPQLVGESLVTHDDLTDEQKNAKLLSKYQSWLAEGRIPVINEDDARSIEEIDIMLKGERAFRDNDGLASLHARFLKKAGYKTMLILLSNTDGIYTAESFRNGEYLPIRVIKNSEGLEEQALPISSARGRGGVLSKIEASKEATLDGICVVIANGQYCNHDSSYQKRRDGSERRYNVLEAILDGKVVGSRFIPSDYVFEV